MLVRVERLDGTTQVGRVTPDAPDFFVTAAATSSEVALTYLKPGVEHILPGIDHLLFVLALLILVQGTRRLIVTITAFTVAHSITLAGASLGVVSVPSAPGRGKREWRLTASRARMSLQLRPKHGCDEARRPLDRRVDAVVR